MTITYCTRADIEAIWSAAAVLRAADDDQDGELSLAEQGYLTTIIERAANRLNASLEMRYALADLSDNTWCRDANAVLAVYLLATRRGNAAPDHLRQQYEQLERDLDEIRFGRLKVPQAADSHATTPTVTNFDTRLGHAHAKVRRVNETSTGDPPPGSVRSFS